MDNRRLFKMVFCFTTFFFGFARLSFGQTCCADGNSIVTNFAGTGTMGYTGNGGAATSAELSGPYSVALDSAGNVYIAEYSNATVREISTSGIITPFAGNQTHGYSGDGGAATSAQLDGPTFIAFDSLGNLYISDSLAYVIRKVSTGGIITTFAGTGTPGDTGDGGPATSAEITPYDLAVDQFGDVIFTDNSNHVIRKIAPNGIISTIAGTGVGGYSGNGVLATTAELNVPEGVAFDNGSASIYFWDDLNFYVRKIDSCGIITTIAGNGVRSYSGDGGPATSASLSDAEGLAFCGGNLYLADWANATVRVINSCGIINTIGGINGDESESGDGGVFTSATMYEPVGIAFDPAGNLYIADYAGQFVREVSHDCAPTPTPACVLLPTATPACTQPVTPTFTPLPPCSGNTCTPTNTPPNTPTSTPSFTPTATPSLTPTFTVTPSPTSTVTSTSTLTTTRTPTSSPTATGTPTSTFTPACVPQVWPDPFNPKYAKDKVLKIGCLTPGSTVTIYTLSGEKVWSTQQSAFQYGSPFTAVWEGKNQNGALVSPGLYYYVIQDGSQVTRSGKFLVIGGP